MRTNKMVAQSFNFRGLFLSLFGVFLILVSSASWASEGAKEPKEVIQEYADQTVKLLRKDNLQNTDDLKALRDKLYQSLAPIVDFRLMTQSALGPHARSLSKDQVDELRRVFQPLVVNLYLDRLFAYLVHKDNPWALEDVVVESQEFKMERRYALVHSYSKVSKDNQSRKLSMNFKMINQDGHWMVYDMVFEGVSLVENYRSQFGEILSNHSYDHLKNKLEDRLDQFAQSDTATATIRN